MSNKALNSANRGHAAFDLRYFAAAHVHYDEAIHLSPGEMSFYVYKSHVFFEEGKYEDCIAACKIGLNVGSENKIFVALAMTLIAKAKKAQGKYSEALFWFEKSSVEYPNPETDARIADLRQTVRRRPLSFVYTLDMYTHLMEVSNDYEAGERLRRVVHASPVLSTGFIEFLEGFLVSIRDHDAVYFLGHSTVPHANGAIYVKQIYPFSWIGPFIVQFSICDVARDMMHVNEAYDLLPRTTDVLKTFLLWVPDGFGDLIHPNVLPFLRRQMPNLEMIQGSPDMFLELRPNPRRPKAFKSVSIAISQFRDLYTLFETKRFTTHAIEFRFVEPLIGDFDFASELITFLRSIRVRFPETYKVSIGLPVLSARFPVCKLFTALRIVFPNFDFLFFDVELNSYHQVLSYDYDRFAADHAFIVREIKNIPSEINVDFIFAESVKFVVGSLQALFDIFTAVPYGFVSSSDLSTVIKGIVNDDADKPICHGNKWLRYELFYKFK